VSSKCDRSWTRAGARIVPALQETAVNKQPINIMAKEIKDAAAGEAPRDIVLHQQRAKFDRKEIELTLNENSRGRYARARESSGKRFNNIVVPESGFRQFGEMWEALVEISNRTPH
jgi:hypothetical protein